MSAFHNRFLCWIFGWFVSANHGCFINIHNEIEMKKLFNPLSFIPTISLIFWHEIFEGNNEIFLRTSGCCIFLLQIFCNSNSAVFGVQTPVWTLPPYFASVFCVWIQFGHRFWLAFFWRTFIIFVYVRCRFHKLPYCLNHSRKRLAVTPRTRVGIWVNWSFWVSSLFFFH